MPEAWDDLSPFPENNSPADEQKWKIVQSLMYLEALLNRKVKLEDIEKLYDKFRSRLEKANPGNVENVDKFLESLSKGVPEVLENNRPWTVKTQRSPTRIATSTNMLSREDTKELFDRLGNQLLKSGPDNHRVTVTRVSQNTVTPPSGPRPNSPDQTVEVITILDIQVVNPEGKQIQVGREKLQQVLDEFSKNEPNVKFAETAKDRIAEWQNDPHFTARGTWGQDYQDQWAIQRIGFDEARQSTAWNALQGEQRRVIVAVIGSGVDWTHPELLGQIWVNTDEDPDNGRDDDGNGIADDVFGWNFRDDTNDVMDHGGHDTHVAGAIAARSNNGYGIAGINPYARIMPLKIANFTGQSNSIDISRAIFYAVDNGARVINISYGGASPSQVEQRAMDYAQTHDVLVVVAAGNKSVDASKYALASCEGALTVSGTTVEDTRAPFSNWGQVIDLSAPAMDILSLRARDTDFLLYTDENPSYESGTGVVGETRDLYRASGTSFAAPLVTGTASLIISANPELSSKQVRRMLIMSTRDIETPGWDQYTGAGILDAGKAVTADPDYYLVAQIDQVKPVRVGNQISIQIGGKAMGSHLRRREIQIGFGENPAEDAWITIQADDDSLDSGVLGAIPATSFKRKGVWTVRLIVTDTKRQSRQARARLDLN